MPSLQRLQEDHETFHATLDALDSALGAAGEWVFVMRELCFRLLTQLRDHAHREGDVLASCHAPLGARELGALADGHDDELQALQEALWEMAGPMGPETMARVRRRLDLAITQLRYHMAEQEYKLYPALAWVKQKEELSNRIARWWPAERLAASDRS